MNQSDWKDREIEDLVKQLPHIKDNRTPQSIYSKMERHTKKTFVPFRRYMPAFAALTAIFILFLLAPAVMDQLTDKSMENSELSTAGSTENKAQLHSDMKESEVPLETNKDEKIALTENAKKENSQLMISEDQSEREAGSIERLSLYEEDLEGKGLYSFGLVSPDAVPIPVSIVDEPAEKNWLFRHEQIAKKLPETNWGLEDYLPLKGEFSLDDNKVIFTLDSDHSYSGSSAAEYAFYYSLQYSFLHRGFKEIVLKEHDGSVPQFSSTGELSKIDLNEEDHSAYYMYSPDGKERFLVPDNVNRGNVKDSIQAMSNADTDLFQSVIPKNINFNVTESDGLVTISFRNQLDLEAMDDQIALEMLEGILLTSRSSGYENAQFENIKQESWNGFDFNGPIETPISPNRKRLAN